MSDQAVAESSCPTLYYCPGCSLRGSPVLGISQAGMLEWVAIPSLGGSCRPRDWSCISCMAGRFFTTEPSGAIRSDTHTALVIDEGVLFCKENCLRNLEPCANCKPQLCVRVHSSSHIAVFVWPRQFQKAWKTLWNISATCRNCW